MNARLFFITMKESFVFFETWAEAIRQMPDKERLQVYDAIMAYGIYGEKTEIGGLAQMALNLVFNDIDDCKKKRNEKTEKARESANKRWQKANADECERMRTHTNACERKQTDAAQCYNVNVNGNVNVNDNVNVNGVKENADKSAKHTKFIPPTLDEVKAYCQERKNTVDPQRFIDFYSAKGWMVGKNKMKDWRASVRTWEQPKQTKLPIAGNGGESLNRNIEGIWK